jgi:hypothetical protein
VFSAANGKSISATDPNVGASDSLTIAVTHGILTLPSTTGLTFTSGSSNGSASLSVTGTLSSLNAALNGLIYQSAANYTGSDSLVVSLSDTGDGLSASRNVALTINLPAPPAITAPPTALVAMNGTLVFSSGNGNAISVFDAAAGGNGDSLTLSVAHGTLTLGSTSGVSFTSGANNSGSFTVSGTVANLNAVLSSLTYKPTANFVGFDSLAISLTDPGDNESASSSVALGVGKPSITAPGAAAVGVNGSLVFSSANSNAIAVTDSGPGSGSDSLTLTVAHGTVTLSTTSGLTITTGANGSASITVTGSAANLNTALNGLTFRPTTGYMGLDSVAVSIQDTADNLSASASVALTVSSPPAITAPAKAAVIIRTTLVFSSANNNPISIADVSAGSAVEPLTLTATDGTLSLGTTSGITFTSGANNSTSMTISGTLASLNAALSGLTFTPAAVGSATVVLSYTDLGNGLMASAVISITVGKGPFGTGGGGGF